MRRIGLRCWLRFREADQLNLEMIMKDDLNSKLKFVLAHISSWGRYYVSAVLASPNRLLPAEYEKLIEGMYEEMKEKEKDGNPLANSQKDEL